MLNNLQETEEESEKYAVYLLNVPALFSRLPRHEGNVNYARRFRREDTPPPEAEQSE